MNDRLIKLALDAGLLNYVDNETPRRYFINGHADIQEVEDFANSIIYLCASIADGNARRLDGSNIAELIGSYFGIEINDNN